MPWTELSDWWRTELREDTAYEEIITPLLLEILQPRQDRLYLDLGCGEGRVMRTVEAKGGIVHGIDLSGDLVNGLQRVIVAKLPEIPMRTSVYDGIYCVLTLEHTRDHITLFAEASRALKPNGVLALVMNHPIWTAPDSTPITDTDGEVLWRPGSYFSDGVTALSVEDREVAFYHRPMAEMLNSASRSRLHLEKMIERPHHELTDQPGIPRILACRWRKPAVDHAGT